MSQLVFAVSGRKNSGKTTLVEKLTAALSAQGFRVATIKHDAHEFDADVPGRDSHRHRAAGAYATAVFDQDKWQVIKNGQQTIEGLLAFFPEADIVILEGAKQTEWPKIEVVRAGNTNAPVCDPRTMIALATDLPLTLPGVPTVDINNVQTMVRIILSSKERLMHPQLS